MLAEGTDSGTRLQGHGSRDGFLLMTARVELLCRVRDNSLSGKREGKNETRD